jgi:hypothetical protein
MRGMRFALLSCALILIGCGGNGGGGNEPPFNFAGHWTGTWDDAGPQNPPPPGLSGSFDLNISESGQVTGTCVNTGYGETGQVTGTVTPDGDLDCSINYPTKPDAIFYGEPGTDLTGVCWFGSEDYTKTVHLYRASVQMSRE